jgi:uncharacterized protein YggE
MKKPVLVYMIVFLAGAQHCRAQVGGNAGFAQAGGKAKAEQDERNKRVLSAHEVPPTGTSMFVEANVLMNVKPDEYVAVFGVARDDETVAGCGRKMEATLKEFTDDLKTLGVAGDDIFVDFVTQNKVYGYEITGNIAREKLVGFELKKNVLIHYKDRALLDKLVVSAAKSQIFDLIKVDTIVKDSAAIQDRIMAEASRIIKSKINRYEKLLDIKLKPPAQVYAERSGVHYPTDLYDSYVAQDSEQVGVPFNRQNYTIQTARKGRTFYFNALDSNRFDDVINPIIIEPVVQFTLYLKVKYEVEQIKAK